MATLISDPHRLSLRHVCVKLLDWQKQCECETRKTECVDVTYPAICSLCRLIFATSCWTTNSVKRWDKQVEIFWWLACEQQIHSICFPGKMKKSDSISQIYTSLWKPWSYLTGSSETASTGAAHPASTTQKTTTIRGFTFVNNHQICSSVISKRIRINTNTVRWWICFIVNTSLQASHRAVMFRLLTGQGWWT